jgi:hypothetical protein
VDTAKETSEKHAETSTDAILICTILEEMERASLVIMGTKYWWWGGVLHVRIARVMMSRLNGIHRGPFYHAGLHDQLGHKPKPVTPRDLTLFALGSFLLRLCRVVLLYLVSSCRVDGDRPYRHHRQTPPLLPHHRRGLH